MRGTGSKLSFDSTYEFTDSHRKAVVPAVSDRGTWSISKGELIMVSSHDPAALPEPGIVRPDTLRLKIKNHNNLTLPKGVWNKNRTVALKRVVLHE